MQIEHILTVFAIMVTNLGTVLALFMYSDKKLEEHRKETTSILEGIRQEMKDFHTRLALQDQEFKMRIASIEEKIKK